MTTIRCDRTDLAWALRAVLPHVLRERGYLPALEGIRLEADPGTQTLYAVATDRFTLGVARVDAAVSVAAATTVGRSDVGEMLRRLRAKGECELAIYDDGEVSLDWRARWQPQNGYGNYPDWRTTAARSLHYPAVRPGPGFGWNSAYMARFAPAARDSSPLVFMHTGKRHPSGDAPVPVTVVLGEQFTGMVMSVRLPGLLDAPAALRRWRELLPAEAAKEASNA